VTRDERERTATAGSDAADGDAIDVDRLAEMKIPALTGALYDHLEATAARPIDPTANRWLGEATAVAADVADGSAPESAIGKRAGQVRALLGETGPIEDDTAATHVDAAERIAATLCDRLGTSESRPASGEDGD
jgi:hypothetical protein